MPSPWAWHAHPSVWAVIGLVAGLYAAAILLLGPRLGPTPRRKIATFYVGVLVMWIASDWPMHDLAERYLFSVHMVQHILLTLVIPPMLLVGTPDWLMRWLLQPRAFAALVREVARPLPAAIIYNVTFVFTHWPPVVDSALHHELVHFGAHCLIFFTALNMWFPVMNRLPEFPMMTPPARMVYLFLQSVIPTVPASFLTFADGVIYKFYATVPHPFHMSAVADQQLAGALMKVLGGSILWGFIVVMFFRWYAEENRNNERGRWLPRPDVLTWDDVARELERTPPPPGVKRLATLLIAGSVLAGACGGGGATTHRAEVGKRAPTFVAPRLIGSTKVRLTDLHGKAVLVNFFASWCGPCRDELPLLQRAVDAKQVAVVGVLFNDSASDARRFLRQLGVTFPTADDDGSIARAYGVATKPGLPVTFAISPDGVLAARHIGQLRAQDVPDLIHTAMASH